MPEAISGGIFRMTKTKLKQEIKEDPKRFRILGVSESKKKRNLSIPSRSKRREAAKLYKRWCKTELCCLPTKEQIRKAKKAEQYRRRHP